MSWSLNDVQIKLQDINKRGFISIPPSMYRHDEGVIGQILEREFGVEENNLSVRDLGEFELKGMRRNSSTLTLCHKKTDNGLTPIQVFDRFGYVRPSNRNETILKKKLFSTITGKRQNSLHLILEPNGVSEISMFFKSNYICGWNLNDSLIKMNQIILAIAETKGQTGSRDETFHYVEAYLLNGLKKINELVKSGAIVIDFCIDQTVGGTKSPHDRGPHIRMPKRKIFSSYQEVKRLL